MRLVETVAREFLEQVEDLVGLGGRDAVGVRASLHEGFALLHHLLELLLAHGPAQQVGAAEGVAGQDLRRLHDLLLINQNAIGLAGDGLQQCMGIEDLLLAMPPLDEVRNQVHRTRTVERDECGDVLDRGDLELLAQVAHAPGFQLEHAEGLGVVEQVVGLGVVERQVVEVELDAGGFPHHLRGVADDRQGLETQEVHLQQAQVADRPHGVLGDDAAVVVLLERQQIHQGLGSDDHAGRMDADAPGLVFQQQGRLDEFAGDLLFVVGLLELSVLLERVLQAPLHIGDHLGQAVGLRHRQAHDPTHVTDHRLRTHGAKGDDLGDGVAAVLVADVANHLGPSIVGEIDVDIGRADTLGIEETLEEQPVAQGINVRDLEQVGDHGAGGRSARHAGDAVVATPAHEITHNQEVRDVSGLLDDPELQVQSVEDLADGRVDLGWFDGSRGRRRLWGGRWRLGAGGRCVGSARIRHCRRSRCGGFRREKEHQPLRLGHGLHHDGGSLDMSLDRVAQSEPVAEQLAQVALAGPRLGRLEHRIMLGTLAVAYLQIALLGHLDRVQHRFGHLGEEVLHLLRRPQEELLLLVAHPLGIAQLRLGADANEAVVGPRVVLLDIVDVVGGDALEPELLGPRYELAVDLGLLGNAVVLELQIEVPGPKGLLEEIDRVPRALEIVLENGLRDLAGEAAAQADQALPVGGQEFLVDARLVVVALQMGRGHQLDQVLVTDLVAGQQHQMVIDIAHAAGSLLLLESRSRSNIHLAAQDGLDAGLLGCRVKLDGPEHVAVVSHGHGGEVQFLGPGHQPVETAGGVEQGELGVQVKMGEVGGHRGPHYANQSLRQQAPRRAGSANSGILREIHSGTHRVRTQGAPDQYAGFVIKKSQRDKISASVGGFPGCGASKTTWQDLSCPNGRGNSDHKTRASRLEVTPRRRSHHGSGNCPTPIPERFRQTGLNRCF